MDQMYIPILLMLYLFMSNSFCFVFFLLLLLALLLVAEMLVGLLLLLFFLPLQKWSQTSYTACEDVRVHVSTKRVQVRVCVLHLSARVRAAHASGSDDKPLGARSWCASDCWWEFANDRNQLFFGQ